MANTVSRLTAILQMNNTSFRKGLTQSEKALKRFQKQVATIGGMIAGAFSVRAIANFTRETYKLAAAAEGVEAAFARIADGRFLREMQRATKNTVADLELMRTAVTAERFGIDLEALPQLLKFAAKYAQDTGAEVDILVEKIVRGIGRKSVLILDDLGLTATQVRDALGGISIEAASVGQLTQAIGEIAEDSFKKTGDLLDTTGLKLDQLRAKFENFKKSWGDFWQGKGTFQEVSEKIWNDNAVNRFLNKYLNPQMSWEEDPVFNSDFWRWFVANEKPGSLDGWIPQMSYFRKLNKNIQGNSFAYSGLFPNVRMGDSEIPFGFKSYFKQSGLWGLTGTIAGQERWASGPHPSFTPSDPAAGIEGILGKYGIGERKVGEEYVHWLQQAAEKQQKLNEHLQNSYWDLYLVNDELEDVEETDMDKAAEQWMKMQTSVQKAAMAVAQYSGALSNVSYAISGISANKRLLDELKSINREAFDASQIERYNHAIQELQRSYERLWQSILSNVGAILINVGAQMVAKGNLYGGLGLIIAGAGVEIGVGIWQGQDQGDIPDFNSTQGQSHSVEFQLSGQNLAATMNTNQQFKQIAT